MAGRTAQYAERGRMRLRYRSDGHGPPVLLVMGYGMTLEAWWRTTHVLARDFRVLRFDNRGIGGSRAAAMPYSAADMADDAVAVLDAAGEERAHVYGISLGGMVAQEIALRHPERVGALVLGATTSGGSRAVPGERAALSLFSRAIVLTDEESAWAAVPYLYADATRARQAHRIGGDIARRGPGAGLVTNAQQLLAAVAHSTAGRLGEIRAPTLVVHGAEDRLIPAENGHRLARAIPRARLSVWHDAAHLYTTDEPRADAEVAAFLGRHSPDEGGLRVALRRLRAAARQRIGH